MKNIIKIFLIFLSINVFAQTGNSLSVFRNQPEYIEATKTIIECVKNNWDVNEYFNDVYSFHANNNIYLLSYENQEDYNRPLTYILNVRGDEIIRNLYLYKIDKYTLSWSIASDVIKIDYIRCNNVGNSAYSYYYSRRKDLSPVTHINDGINHGSITILENGYVNIIIPYFEKNYDDVHKDYLRSMIVTLIPTDNNNYIIKQ